MCITRAKAAKTKTFVTSDLWLEPLGRVPKVFETTIALSSLLPQPNALHHRPHHQPRQPPDIPTSTPPPPLRAGPRLSADLVTVHLSSACSDPGGREDRVDGRSDSAHGALGGVCKGRLLVGAFLSKGREGNVCWSLSQKKHTTCQTHEKVSAFQARNFVQWQYG